MRLSLGGFSQVTMTDRWFQELRAGRAFAGRGSIGAVGGQNGHVQLKNPAASGKQAIVAQIRVNILTAGYVAIATYDTDLATDVGAVSNLLMGGSAGVCHVRSTNNAGLLGTSIAVLYLPANTPTILWPSWGPELSPGKGICIDAGTVNVQIDVDWLINEV